MRLTSFVRLGLRHLALAVVYILTPVSSALAIEQRVALVIGAEDYTTAQKLVNPLNDARAIAAALTSVGFQSVDLVANPKDLAEFGAAISAFEEKARNADVAVVYYAGHGVSVDGMNWLLPTGINIQRKQELRYEAITADDLVRSVRGASKVRLVILDACRNNPFEGLSNFDSSPAVYSGGLSAISGGNNVVVLMATSPGATASDGAGKSNSPFGAALAYLIQKPGMRLVALPSEVSHYVQRMTFNTQRPDQQGIPDDVDWAFSPDPTTASATITAADAPTAAPSTTQNAPNPMHVELAYWNACCAGDAAQPQEFQAYLSKVEAGEFPGTFRDIAQRRSETGRSLGPQRPAPVAALPAAAARVLAPNATIQAGQLFRDCATCPQMVALPNGTFFMGSPPQEAGRISDEGPQISVDVQAFAAGRYEVTRGEFAAFVKATNHSSDGGCYALDKAGNYELDAKGSWKRPGYAQDDDHPATCISWEDATAFAAWLSKTTQQNYRLLSEAEWEYAARAGTTGPYYFGDSASDLCRFTNGVDAAPQQIATRSLAADCDDTYTYTAPVGQLGNNRFKLADMLGNAREWTNGCYSEVYSTRATNDADCSYRVLRGGSWNLGAQSLRSASRNAGDPTGRGNAAGFRVARNLSLQPVTTATR